MRMEKVIVDENIVETIKKDRMESYHRYNDGVGMWGRRALDYIFSDEPLFIMQIELEETGRINEYGKLIDQKAHELFEIMEPKLLELPEYQMTDDYMSNLQKQNAIKHIIEEQIYAELIYVNELVQP